MRRIAFVLVASIVAGAAALGSPSAPTWSGLADAAWAAPDFAAAERAHSDAVFQLVMLQRRVSDAERESATVERDLADLKERHAAAAARAERADADLLRLQESLSKRLVEAYRAKSYGWLELLLSSTSFADFVSRSALVGRILEDQADLMSDVTLAAKEAREATEALDSATAALEADARRLEVGRAELKTALAAQEQLVASLGDRLEEVRAAARAAQERMARENARAATGSATNTDDADEEPRPAAPTTTTTTSPKSAGQDPPSPGGRQLHVKAYAYALSGRTASGLPVGPGIVAVDPRVIKLGTRLYIPGYGEGLAADTGGDIKGNTIDVWVATQREARAWGVRYVTITVYD